MAHQTPEVTLTLLSNGWSYPTLYTKISSPNRKILVIRGVRCPISPPPTPQILPFDDLEPSSSSSTDPSDSFFIERQGVQEFLYSSHTSLNEELASQTIYAILSYLHTLPPTYNLGRDSTQLPDVIGLLKTSNGEFVARYRWTPRVFAGEEEVIAIYPSSPQSNTESSQYEDTEVDRRYSIGRRPIYLDELVPLYPPQRVYIHANHNNHPNTAEQQPIDSFVDQQWLGPAENRVATSSTPRDVNVRPTERCEREHGNDNDNDIVNTCDGVIFCIPHRPKLPEGKAEGETYIMAVVWSFGLFAVMCFCWWVIKMFLG